MAHALTKASKPVIGGLAACLAMVLVGCGSSSSPSASGSGGGTVQLTFLASNLDQAGEEQMISSFTHQYPNIQIKPTFVPSQQEQQLLTTELNSGNGPDLFVTTIGNLGPTSPVELGQHLLDLTGSPWIKTMPAQELGQVSDNGKVVAYPAVLTAGAVIYNKSLFQQHGWQVPTTESQLLTLCGQISKAGQTPLIVPGADTLAGTLLLDSNGSNVFATTPNWLTQRTAGQASFASSAPWQASLQEMVTMKNDGCFGPAAAGTTLTGAYQQIAGGTAAMFSGPSALLGSVLAINPSANLGLFPLPGATAAQTYVGTASGLTLGINAKTAHPAQAKDFFNFLAQPAQETQLAKLTGGVSFYDVTHDQLPAAWSLLAPLFSAGKYGTFWPVTTPNPTTYGYTTTAMQGILTGQLTPAAILKELDYLWNNPTATP